MVVVITNPTAVTDEATIINNLFDEGLEILHIRKPDAAVYEIRLLLQKIKIQYHHKIALHQHHELSSDFGTKRLHFTEINRRKMNDEMLVKLKTDNYVLSTSIHSVQEYNRLSNVFDYIFFGAVFNSISKQGYTAVVADDFIFPVQDNYSKVVAIGGINATNILKVKEMKFHGAAALGTIWQTQSEGILQFKALQKAWKQTGR
jgi:thiamine-phosphate pyrophosphorylase